MRELLLLRHAKSSWDAAGVRDHDRVLNARGERAAPRMGRRLVEQDLIPERSVAATAARARRTAELVAEACGIDDIAVCEDLYLAPPGTLVDVARRRGGDARRLLIVAHNPGLEDLVAQFTGEHEPFPTAALAALRFDIESWDDLALMSVPVVRGVWRPKALDD
ncbi:MAG: SixA phosphatase family protein [Planctomycetota bacterium]